jgi:hypothetical protein
MPTPFTKGGFVVSGDQSGLEIACGEPTALLIDSPDGGS